ncbi:MAG: NAD(P)/FAD-dependent oxidoreductase [Candidatus Caldatribacteriota bacterium]|nr:NAD(P)/FAD-dependent oxidoreductase [Candidatus Caldatribacteriota bacterium]
MKIRKYDVIIIGAGPAGIFTALELTKKSKLSILILEEGGKIEKRECPMRTKGINCIHCSPCALLSGWGGAGAFSDGKLNLSTEIGGQLDNYIDKKKVAKLIKYADDIYLEFGADKTVYGTDTEKIDIFKKKASLAGLELISTRIRHLGTEKSGEILQKMQDHLLNRVDIQTDTKVKKILIDKEKVIGIETSKGETIKGKYVIAAPGRVGSEWLRKQAGKLKIKIDNNPVDVGIRVEVPAITMKHLTDVVYESKLIYYTKLFDDRVRTFCMCPYGKVVTEFSDGITSVNGHSYKEQRTENTNFALLSSTHFTEPFKQPIAYGKYIAHLANILSGGVIIQRLGDLELGRRSTQDRIDHSIVKPTLKEATPGDLSFVLPYRVLTNLLETLKALDKVAPGIYSKHTLIYGAEVKFYSSRLELTDCLETRISNLFTVGDGAGITRGLIQASTSGIIVADEILKRRNNK